MRSNSAIQPETKPEETTQAFPAPQGLPPQSTSTPTTPSIAPDAANSSLKPLIMPKTKKVST